MRKLGTDRIPTLQQLPLPLGESDLSRPAIPPEPSPIQPPRLWLSLTPTLQAQVRLTLLRILQEVVHDAPRA